MKSKKKTPEEIVKETFEITALPKGHKLTVRVNGKAVKVKV